MRSNDDQGSITLETAIVFPGLILVMVLFLQLGLAAYTHHVVSSSAHEAAAVAGLSGTGAGSSAGNQMLRSIDSITTGSGIRVESANNETVTMVGQATVISLFPGLHITVRASGTAVVERFRPEGEDSP